MWSLFMEAFLMIESKVGNDREIKKSTFVENMIHGSAQQDNTNLSYFAQNSNVLDSLTAQHSVRNWKNWGFHEIRLYNWLDVLRLGMI